MIQAETWAGSFGDDYLARQIETTASNIHLFKNIFGEKKLESAIEYGAGCGWNLLALNKLMPECQLTGVEINKRSCDEMKKYECIDVRECAAQDFKNTALMIPRRELTLTKGFLIHVPPDYLPAIYQELYDRSYCYILICEYYNPSPMEIVYRGKNKMLWKRDFAGEMMTRFKDLELVKYGFVYHRDEYPLDDITWFLMRK